MRWARNILALLKCDDRTHPEVPTTTTTDLPRLDPLPGALQAYTETAGRADLDIGCNGFPYWPAGKFVSDALPGAIEGSRTEGGIPLCPARARGILSTYHAFRSARLCCGLWLSPPDWPPGGGTEDAPQSFSAASAFSSQGTFVAMSYIARCGGRALEQNPSRPGCSRRERTSCSGRYGLLPRR